jgi:hypothetical protein
MSEVSWYSTKLRFAVMVEPVGCDLLYERIYLLKGTDFGDALGRALSIGRAAEREYRNSNGQLVSWKLMKVISLDVLSTLNLDGAEIFAESARLDETSRIPFGTTFNPEASEPMQTI